MGNLRIYHEYPTPTALDNALNLAVIDVARRQRDQAGTVTTISFRTDRSIDESLWPDPSLNWIDALRRLTSLLTFIQRRTVG
ncbi:hypothetical protein ACLB1M_23955 [Escherichia coli]